MSREALLTVLARHDVRYVVIGGYAAVLHGWAGVTDDIDITPDDSHDNLERLARALTKLDAKARVEGYPDGFELPGGIDVATFSRATSLAFVTTHGNLDVALLPDGTQGYRDLAVNAGQHSLDGRSPTISVAALADVIRSKQAADRAKDRAVLPQLRELARQSER